MYKIFWLLKRKPGISHEQFRHHYETSHAVLGQKYFGHLILSYKRNYDVAKQAGQEGAFMASWITMGSANLAMIFSTLLMKSEASIPLTLLIFVLNGLTLFLAGG